MNAFVAVVVNASALLVEADEKAPADEDVVAGWTGFAVFAFLIVAVALLGWSLTRQLRKADRAEADGVYGTEEAESAPADDLADDQSDVSK